MPNKKNPDKVTINFRCTAWEKEAMHEAAAAHGMNLTEYIIARVVDHPDYQNLLRDIPPLTPPPPRKKTNYRKQPPPPPPEPEE